MKPLLWLIVFALPSVRPAIANVTDPCNSTVPKCLLVCPAGDMSNTFVLRDFFNPNPGERIDVDLCSCPEVRLCPLTGSETYTIDSTGCWITGPYGDRHGVAELRIRAGGVCSAGHARVFGGGVLLECPPRKGPSIVSPDQNGDLAVDALDHSIAMTKMGTADSTADFDCDGVVSEADLAILDAHLGHSHASTVDVQDENPHRLELAAAAPNPFATETLFRYALPSAGRVRLTVHDLQGRLIATLVARHQGPGQYGVTWNGRGTTGVSARAGVYLVRLEALGTVRARKVILAP